MSALSIVIDLLMRSGSFVTDAKRAEKSLQALKKEAYDTGLKIGDSFKSIAAGAGITLSIGGIVAAQRLRRRRERPPRRDLDQPRQRRGHAPADPLCRLSAARGQCAARPRPSRRDPDRAQLPEVALEALSGRGDVRARAQPQVVGGLVAGVGPVERVGEVREQVQAVAQHPGRCLDAAAVLCGLLPALRTSRTDLRQALDDRVLV